MLTGTARPGRRGAPAARRALRRGDRQAAAPTARAGRTGETLSVSPATMSTWSTAPARATRSPPACWPRGRRATPVAAALAAGNASRRGRSVTRRRPAVTAPAERMARHGFVERPCPDVAAAAAHTVAIQAQDLGQARLGVRARAATVTEADVTAAIADRSVVRTWLMRSTIHLVAADDLRFLVRVFGPMIRRRFAKRWAELGLTPDLLARAEAVVPELLAGGPLTRHEFAAGLRSRGVAVGEVRRRRTCGSPGQLGLTCHADGDRFALLDDWVPGAAADRGATTRKPSWPGATSAAFSPATAADFTAWSGLPSGRPIGLVRDELTPGRGQRPARLPTRRAGARHRRPAAQRLRQPADRLPRPRRSGARGAPRGDLRRRDHPADRSCATAVVVGRWRLDRAAGRVQLTHFGRRRARSGPPSRPRSRTSPVRRPPAQRW